MSIITASAFSLAAPAQPPAPTQLTAPAAVTGAPVRIAAPPAGSNQPAGAAIATNTAAGPAGRDGARLAQRLYGAGKYRESAEAYLRAREGAVTKLQNDCLFNAGCALYKAGQYQEAAAQFAELAARDQADVAGACHNLGCASFEMAAAAARETNCPPELRPRLLEQAGQAFQRALRVNSDRADTRASLAVVADQLPDARETAKREALLAKYQQAQPFQITEEMLAAQRKLNAALPAALTNATPARIGEFENLAELQRGNTDLLIPLQAKLGPLLAGQSNAPAVLQHLDAVKTVMQESRESLRNVDPAGYRSARAAESGIYQFWKGLAPFTSLLKEDLLRQTNAIVSTATAQTQTVDTAEQPIDLDQQEAVSLTRLFTERFSEAVPPGGTPPPAATAAPPPAAPTNAPPTPAGTNAAPAAGGISAATRTNILNLARQAVQAQEQAVKYLAATNLTAALPQQRVSYDLLKEIEKLLPKDKNQQNQQDQQQQDQQQQDQQKQDQQKQEKQDQQKQDQPQPQNQPEPPKPDQQKPPESPPEKQPEQPQPAAPDQAQPKDKEMTPDQAKALLEKARQREQEHEREKMQDQYMPPSPVEKDW